MLADAPAEAAPAEAEPAPRRHGGAALASYGLSQSTLLAARSKSDMARSILADPGTAEKLQSGPGAGGVGRLPHVLLADDEEGGAFSEEYSLLHHQQAQAAQAGPAYSVLTDDGPVRVAAAPAALHHGSPRPSPPRYPAGPVRLSSPISWGRPSAPSLNTRQAASHAFLNPDSTTVPLPSRHHTDEGDMNAEEVGRLML
ncbi:uncharacterized protein LOC113202881 [Frankliniella occidentalis]|uniref:Uncharacterized protein LOC113202881 n=1 Tax=Frankliniella occidentalis TaxID=133901 RepID=A0A6J1S2S1_FRAOC|nr:uncharacterized protein LOC113202881 [Frankliniella occidentalis]